ncbi:ROK family protein [Niabella beijingensis]|uniref:ROK family protein n=1 Tax=Niabella beijingensis TaxID=2872700 RepID=UPI001CBAE045|nr:ROK family protein [Niabella beijingensis]MBZ4191360.1 ROK family protein [Niabella beijingensis]
MNDSIRLGADIGGSHITAALVDVKKARIIEGSVIRTGVDSKASAEEIVGAWTNALSDVMQLAAQPVETLGIAMPGPFDYDAGVCLMKGNDKYESLYGLNIKELLHDATGIPARRIRIANDAGCFLRGEVLAGTMNACKLAIGITLGTGLGTSRYKNGEAADADLWGRSFMNSIAEDYISTRWFLKRYHERTGQHVANVKELAALHDSTAEVRTVFEEFSEHLVSFLYEFVMMDHPEMIVVGGNIARAGRYFMPGVISGLKRRGIDIPVHMAALGEDALILGATL